MLNKAMGLNKGRTMLRFLDTIDGEQNKLICLRLLLIGTVYLKIAIMSSFTYLKLFLFSFCLVPNTDF